MVLSNQTQRQVQELLSLLQRAIEQVECNLAHAPDSVAPPLRYSFQSIRSRIAELVRDLKPPFSVDVAFNLAAKALRRSRNRFLLVGMTTIAILGWLKGLLLRRARSWIARSFESSLRRWLRCSNGPQHR